MKIRQEFKEDMKTCIIWIFYLYIIIVLIGCVYYSYAHFLMDVLRLPQIPLINKDIDPKSEGIIFIHTLLYTILFVFIYTLLGVIFKIIKKLRYYIFE